MDTAIVDVKDSAKKVGPQTDQNPLEGAPVTKVPGSQPSGPIDPAPSDKFKPDYIKGTVPVITGKPVASEADIDQDIDKRDNISKLGKDAQPPDVETDPTTEADTYANQDARDNRRKKEDK